MLEAAFVAALAWLLYKGGKKSPLPSPPQAKGGPTPAKTKWPEEPPPVEHEGFPPGHEPTVTELQAKEASDVARAKHAARNDPKALLEIRRRERERQKALQDYAAQRKAYEESQK